MFSFSSTPLKPVAIIVFAFALCLSASITTDAQDELGDNSADPIKLFEQGQNAHAHGDFEKAVDYYEQAIKLRIEFPEAEFQKGNALVSLNRLPEAETAFRRAIAQRKGWAAPYSSLGLLLTRMNRSADAEQMLRQGLKLEPNDAVILRALADVRFRAGDAKEAVGLAQKAAQEKDAPVSTWVLLAMAQRASGDKIAAKASLDHALAMEPENVAALLERADTRIAEADWEHAVVDLKTAEKVKPGDRLVLSRLFDVYQRTGKAEEAENIARTLGLKNTATPSPVSGEIQVIGSSDEIAQANDADPAKARPALEKLVEKNPRNAMLIAKLGASYRTDDPQKSLDLYRRANQLEPKSVEYAIGYAAALIQSRRFDEAVNILRQVVSMAPNNYVAHANLATALYELKRFNEALPEYSWLLSARPELSVTYFFIATAHDKLGEFQEALDAYELFLTHADAKANELEIEKVKLRLPGLRRQIKLGQGVKRKQS